MSQYQSENLIPLDRRFHLKQMLQRALLECNGCDDGSFLQQYSEFANAANSGRRRSPSDDGERQSVTQTVRGTRQNPNRVKVRL